MLKKITLILLICLLLMACNKIGGGNLPESALSSYIESALKKDYKTVCLLEKGTYERISKIVESAPQSFKEEAYRKALESASNRFDENKLNEFGVMKHLAYRGGKKYLLPSGELYDIIYPNLSYKIIESRDFNHPVLDFDKELIVELKYSGPENSPPQAGIGPNADKKIKKAIIKVYLRNFDGNYKICGYRDTEYGKEYF